MASVRSSSGSDDDDDDGTLRCEPTCWELSSGSKTPNPRPTKTMRLDESSSPPPPPSSEVVIGVDEAPTPVVEDEESPTGEGRDELEETIEYDTDDILDDMEGWGYTPSGAEPDVKKKKEEEEDSETEEEKAFWARVWARTPILDLTSPAKKECHICYGNHYPCDCSYLDRIPYGKDVPNKDYVVVCECGGICEDGGKCPTDGCLLRQARCVVLRSDMMV